jgi:hypothetical protein
MRRRDMNMDALVKKGFSPWRPSPGVRTVDVWHEYDVPTVGIIDLPQCAVLFTAIGETDDRLSVWAYMCLSDDERSKLSGAEVTSVQELRALVDRAFQGHEAVFALADNLAIDQWSRVVVGDDLLGAASDFLTQILTVLESNRDPGARFQAKLAEVEAATQELIDA